MPNSAIHSFDVYDTCLTRVYARPGDVLYAVAHKALRKRQATKEAVHEVVRARMEAERAARAVMEYDDLPLSDIYHHFIPPTELSITGDALMALELEMEAASVQPIPAIASHIEALRSAGKTIIFISDMYLPSSAIKAMLIQHGMAESSDPIYVSGDIGKNKRGGKLFQHVLKNLGVQPTDMTHMGDSEEADIVSAQALGIHAVHTDTAILNPSEKAVALSKVNPCLSHSLMAGISRVARQNHAQENEKTHLLRTIAADHIAPLLTTFTAWVLQDAIRQGIPHLHFVARDGQILYKIAEQLMACSPFNESDLAIHYIYGSRQAWFLPGLYDEDIQSLDWLLIPGHSKAPKDILKKVGLIPQDIPSLSHKPKQWWHGQMKETEAEHFVKELAAETNADIIRQRAKTARTNLRAYLKQEGVTNHTPPVLVDIGWTLKAQRALSSALYGRDETTRVSGYYLGLSMAALPQNEAGSCRAFLLERQPYLDPDQSLNFFFRNANCVEQIFTMADHGQCLGYERQADSMAPILREASDNSRIAVVTTIQETVTQYAKLAAKHQLFANGTSALLDSAVKTAKELLATPTREQASVLGPITIGDDQNESRVRVLARPLTSDDFDDCISDETPRCGYGDSFDWIEGAIALTSSPLREQFAENQLFQKLRTLRISV